MATREDSLSKTELEVERNILNLKVELSDGSMGHIFSRNQCRSETGTFRFTYNCHICSVPNLIGERCLYTHISGRKHQTKLTQKTFDAHLFRAPLQRANRIVMDIAPGEPVPPGFEDEVKQVAEIQKKIDKMTNVTYIGLEYLLELIVADKKEPSYLCVLCDIRGDPRTIMTHLTSWKHGLKYLEKHFPTVTREIAMYRGVRDVFPHIIQKICESIEDTYGRLTPSVYDNDEYEKNRMQCLREIINDKHFSEKNGSTFVHVINKKEIEEWIAKSKTKLTSTTTTVTATKRTISPTSLELNANKRVHRSSAERRRSLDSISSISSSSLDRSPIAHRAFGHQHKKRSIDDKNNDDVIFIRSASRSISPKNRIRQRRSRSRDFSTRNRSRSPNSRTKSPARQKLPTPRELTQQANAISAEKYKWEKYNCLCDAAVKELDTQYAEYETIPEKHPLYTDEWKIFWNRRYKEIQAEKKDPSKYDFTPEWKEFWTKRMVELHDAEVLKKKTELRKSLNLPKDGIERTSELKEQFRIKTTTIRKERVALSPSPPNRSSASRHRDKIERSARYDRSRSRDRVLKLDDKMYKRSSYEHEKSHERYERDRRDVDRKMDRDRDRDRNREHDRERDRDRERERHHRPKSRESFNEDSPIRYARDGRDSVDYFAPSAAGAPPNPYKWHANQPKSHYFTKSHYYGHDVPAATIGKYDEPLAEEEPDTSDDPLTVVTVLRLLSALEELLGPSLGPKIVELLAKALALEKVKANSADDLLINEDNCVLFETIKEKLKGQLMTDMVERNRIKAVKRAIKNIAGVIHLASEKEKNKTPEEKQQEAARLKKNAAEAAESKVAAPPPSAAVATKTAEEEKKAIAKKLAAALVAQGRTNVSKEELETLVNYYYEQRKAKESASQAATSNESSKVTADNGATGLSVSSDKSELNEAAIDLTDDVSDNKREPDEEFDLPQDASSALESLTDTDLQTLLQNFEDLSAEEQQHLHTYMKKLEASDPTRVEKLRKYVHVAFDLPKSDSMSERRGGGAHATSTERHRESSSKSVDSKSESRIGSGGTRKSDPYNDMFYDDSNENGATNALVDSDDDDYSYDDLCKAASKNVKNHQHEIDTYSMHQQHHHHHRSPDRQSDGGDSTNRHDQFILGGERNDDINSGGGGGGGIGGGAHYDDLSNTSRASENSNSRSTIDTENFITNLMGSLQKNAQNRNFADRNQQTATANNSTNDGKMQRSQIQSNVPFYMQQQSQTAYTMPSNQMYSNDFNAGNNQNAHFSSTSAPSASGQYGNAYGNQNQIYGNSKPKINITSNIPLNIPMFGQQQQQQSGLNNQQAAFLAKLAQQQNQRSAW